MRKLLWQRKEKPMKKLWILLIALCLSMALLPAQAAEGAVNLDTPSDVLSIAAQGDTFYLLAMDNEMERIFYTYRVGDQEPTLLMAGAPEYTLPDGETSTALDTFFLAGEDIYALNLEKGMLLKLEAQEGKTVISQVTALDFEDFYYTEYYNDNEYTYTMNLQDWACIGQKLFVKLTNYYDGSGEPQLYSLDLVTGEKTLYASEFIQSFAPYKDGKLLCMVVDENDAYDSEKNAYKPVQFSVFDPETDTLEPLFEVEDLLYYNVSGLAYQPEGDFLYIVCPERILRVSCTDGASELGAYVPTSWYRTYEGCAIARVGDCVMVNGENGVFVRRIDPASLPDEVLTIYGGYNSDAHSKAIAKMDDIPVVFYEKGYYSTAQELGQAMVSGENEIDVLIVSLNFIDFQRMMEKGYCYDLSGSEKLSALAQQFYPIIQNEITQDGKLCAMPISSYVNTYTSSSALETKLKLEKPTSMVSLCQFLNDWGEKGYYEEFSDYQPFDETELRQLMISNALEMYVAYMQATNQTLTLDTPEFRQVMEAASAIDSSDYEMDIDWSDQDSVDELFSKNALFYSYNTLSIHKSYSAYSDEDFDYYSFLPLTLTDETPLYLPMQVDVMFINPRSQHLEAAIRYMELYMENLDTIDLAMMCPDMNEPIENPYYEENLAEYQESIDSVLKALETCKEEDRQAYQDSLENLQTYMEKYKEKQRYLADEESIAAYRAVDSQFFVLKPNIIYGDDDSLTQLFMRYMDGQLPLEQLIQEGDAKLRLMQNE